jgi:hypothetical protein
VDLVVYADFTNPQSRLASRRVDALRAAGVAVDWRAVESQPRVPVTGGHGAARLADLAREHHEVTRLRSRRALGGASACGVTSGSCWAGASCLPCSMTPPRS